VPPGWQSQPAGDRLLVFENLSVRTFHLFARFSGNGNAHVVLRARVRDNTPSLTAVL
jgi:hypothetical protein